jgi:arylsulfatase A-like enzyme
LVQLVDLLPTVCDLAHTEASHTHFGRSLLPLLREPTAPHRAAAFSEGGFARHEGPLVERAAYPNDQKAAIQQDNIDLVGRAISLRTGDWTFVHRSAELDELYDRHADPAECQNLAGGPQHAELERRLREQVLAWLVETADVIPWQSDPRFEPEFFELLKRGGGNSHDTRPQRDGRSS